jgi:hypothetical protein
MFSSPKPRVTFPYLLVLTSVLMPAFGILNGFDVFYFGLLKSEALAFLSGFLMASIWMFFIVFRQMPILLKISLNLLGLLLLAIIFNLMQGLIDNSHFAVNPTVATGIEAKEENLLFVSTGYFFGSLIGFGVGNWIKSLRSTNLSKRLSIIAPLVFGVMVSTAGLNMFFLGNFYFTVVLTVIGISFSLIVSMIAQKNL